MFSAVSTKSNAISKACLFTQTVNVSREISPDAIPMIVEYNSTCCGENYTTFKRSVAPSTAVATRLLPSANGWFETIPCVIAHNREISSGKTSIPSKDANDLARATSSKPSSQRPDIPPKRAIDTSWISMTCCLVSQTNPLTLPAFQKRQRIRP